MKPYPGYIVKENSTVNIDIGYLDNYNKNVVMPNLIGYSLDSAIEILENLELNYTVEGEGSIVEQSTPKGEMIDKGTEIKLKLKEEYGD